MEEQERPAAGHPEHPAAGETAPIPPPAPHVPGRRRGEAVRRALTSRGAGWVVATALAGAVIALSVVLATAPAQVVRQISLGRPTFAGPAFVGPVCGPLAGTVHMPPGGRIQVVIPPAKRWAMRPPPGKRVEVPVRAGMVPPRCLVPWRGNWQISP